MPLYYKNTTTTIQSYLTFFLYRNQYKYIYTHFYCDNNDIESFDFLPDNVGGYIDLIGNIKLGNFQLTTDFERLKQLLEAKKINKLLPNEKKIRPPRP